MKGDYQVEVSVLMTLFNTQIELIKRAINSVLSQDFQNFELIIIDDGSDECTQSQLLEFLKTVHHKIVYIRHENCGQSQSINRGVLNSRAPYIAILDSDDEYKINHLSSCLKEIKDLDLIASTTETIVDCEEDYLVPDKWNNLELIHVDDCILFATLFGKREVFDQIKFESKYAADAQFFEKASIYYKVEKVNLRTYIYYRNNPDSICSVLKRETQFLYSN